MNDFKRILSKNKGPVLNTILLNIAASFVMVYAGYALAYIFTGYESGVNRAGELARSCIKVFGIWGLAILIYYFAGIVQASTLKRLKNDLRLHISEKITSVDYEDFAEKDSGNYISWLTNDVENIANQSFLSLFSVVTSVSTVLFSIGALFLISVYVGAASILLFFFVSVLPQIATRGLKKANKARSISQEESLERFKDSIMGFPIFYLSRLLDTMTKRIDAASDKVENANYLFTKRSLGIQSFIIAMSTFGQIVILTITVFAAIIGAAPIGAVISVGNLSGSFFNSVSEVARSYSVLKASKAIWEKFRHERRNESGSEEIDSISDIALYDISFGYDKKEILRINAMRFEGKGKYALIGESGSGKTTLVKLMIGLLEIQGGTILYGNKPLDAISKDSLYRRVAYVEQKVYLFQDTLRFNITLGVNYSEEHIVQTLERCCLKEYVDSLPNGLDTLIAEDGKNMSGGQRQRIALARALIRNVDFLILDEGTAALDEANALDIESNLVDDPSIGVVIITHNLRETVRKKLDAVYEIKSSGNKT